MSGVVEQVVLYTGPMSAGKTTRLYDAMGTLDGLEVPYVAFQPMLDVRSAGVIRPKTHNSRATAPNCIQVASLLDIAPDHLKGVNVVAVDEFTLFGFDKDRQPIEGYYETVMRHLANLGVTAVYASGLNVAANRRIFPLLEQAIEHGADVQMLAARCMVPTNGQGLRKCGEIARNSQIFSMAQGRPYHPDTLPMLLPEGERPDLGYRPVCAGHLAVDMTVALDFRVDYP